MSNFDDPIADLLSDGSDDSFFDDPKIRAKKSTPKKTPALSASDVFQFEPKTEANETKKNDDWLGLSTEIKPATINKKAQPVNETKRAELKEDVTDLLQTETKGAKKASILNEILGESSKKEEVKVTSFEDILQSSKLVKKDSLNEIKPSVKVQNDPVPVLAPGPRRGRRNSPTIIDPLGLFETQKKEQPKENEAQTKITITDPVIVKLQDIPKSSGVKDLPEWLGKTKPENEETTKPKEIHPDNSILDTLLTQQKITSSNVQLQNASLSLQQQESQLMIAVQMKKYEENLSQIQRQQQEMLTKQEQQFNTLLEQQFTKQQLLENSMRSQQERINNHVQLLMSQTSSQFTRNGEDPEEQNGRLKEVFEQHRKYYDEIITSLKLKHSEEVFLLDESYKKQIHFLEESLEGTELRLKTEMDSIQKFYTSKIEKLINEKENIIKSHEDKINHLQESNKMELNDLKENCKISVEDIRSEYKKMIDGMLETKLSKEMIETNSEMLTKKMSENLDVLNINTKAIDGIQSRINQERNFLIDVRNENLNAKELEIKMMHSSLEKQRVSNDHERAQLLTLIRTLETRLVEQTQAAREERWTFQQATAMLSARSSALDREAEFVRRNLEVEREQIKTLKQTLLIEHESVMLKLNEEKLALTAEKSRLETSVKLADNFNATKTRTEIEAALKLAKEATELTDKERETLLQQQCEVETVKRNLQDRETRLAGREQELERLLRETERKCREGERALNEAKATEYQNTERFKDIQKQLSALATREKKITEDKIAISRERVAIHNQMIENKKCGLCETQAQSSTKWNTDVEILRLKYDLENDNIVSKELSSLSEHDCEI